MKHVIKVTLVALLAGILAGCSGSASTAPEPRIIGLYGSSSAGVELTGAVNAGSLRLSFASVPTSGQFVSIELPEQMALAVQTWDDSGVLALAAPVPEGIEVGIVPLAGYAGSPVVLDIDLLPETRGTSAPPVGLRNVVTDLEVLDLGSGMVALEWTQLSVGDYDFNGEVNAADLVPIAGHFLETYDRAAPGANLLTAYWIDGDGNGEINAADITPIAGNFRAFVAGYSIRHNGARLGTADSPTVERSAASPRTGLPPRYHVELPGATTDKWAVAPVDSAGVEGASSDGSPGPVDLIVGLDITGIELFDLENGQPGGFGEGKFSSRIIAPGDIVNRFTVAPANIDGTTVTFNAVPRGRTYLLDIIYQPTVDPASGDSRGGSSLRGTSAQSADDVITSLPIHLPDDSAEPVEVETEIHYSPNPAGGYFIDVTAQISMPGDDPSTPAIENGYVIQRHTRLDYASGIVSQDNDLDGSFDNDVRLRDDDRDCVSERLAGLLDTDDNHDGIEYEIEGRLLEFDELQGYLVLQGPFEVEGVEAPPSPVTIQFDESTSFKLRHRTPDNEDGKPLLDIDPSTLQVNDKIEVYLRTYRDDEGNIVATWWGRLVKKVIDER